MAPGHRPIHRFTVDPRRRPPSRRHRGRCAALGLAARRAVDVADVVFVEGDLDDRRPRPARRVPRRPAAADRHRGTSRRPDAHVEITLHPGVTDSAADAVVHAAAQLGVAVAAAATGRRIEFPAGTDDATSTCCSAGSSPTRSSSAGRTAPAEPVLHPGADDAPAVEIVRRPRPRRRRPRRASAPSGRWPSTPRSCGSSATTSTRSAATRPTSSWRRWPRRGASTAPTRRSGPPSRPPTASSEPVAARPAARRHRRRRPRRSCGRRSSATPAIVVVRARHDDRPQGRDPQPPVGRRAVRRRQHRRRRRDPRRPGRRPPADRRAPTCCASARPTCRVDDLPDGVAAPAAHPRRRRSTASPTTATRSACRPSPAPCSTTRRTRPTRSCSAAASASPPTGRCPTARSPATGSSCSAGAPAATASAGPRSPAPRWTPPPARSPGPACRSATRSPRSC